MLASHGMRLLVLLAPVALSACGNESSNGPGARDSVYVPDYTRSAGARVPQPQDIGLLLNVSMHAASTRISPTNTPFLSPNDPLRQ